MPRTFKPFYGWWIVVVSAITLLLSGGIGFYSFGAFFTPLINEFGWNRAQDITEHVHNGFGRPYRSVIRDVGK